MKVFYQRQTWRALQPGEPESATVEDVEFSADLYDELDRALERSQRLLPPTAKKFQGWEVGLLERFEVLEAGMGGHDAVGGKASDGMGGEAAAGGGRDLSGNGVDCEIPSEDVD
jgi:hypothetical protein